MNRRWLMAAGIVLCIALLVWLYEANQPERLHIFDNIIGDRGGWQPHLDQKR